MVEPAFEPANDTHVIYEGHHLHFPSGTCGHGHNISTVSHTSAGGLPQSFRTRVWMWSVSNCQCSSYCDNAFLESVTFCLEDELTCIIQHVMSLLMQMRGLWLPSLPMHANTRLESWARHQRLTEDPYITVLTLKMFLSQQSYLNRMFRRHCIDSKG